MYKDRRLLTLGGAALQLSAAGSRGVLEQLDAGVQLGRGELSEWQGEQAGERVHLYLGKRRAGKFYRSGFPKARSSQVPVTAGSVRGFASDPGFGPWFGPERSLVIAHAHERPQCLLVAT